MKNCPFTYLAILLSFFIWSCQGDVKDQESTKYGLLSTEGVTTSLSFQTANERINKYNAIYGDDKKIKRGGDYVILPRYFIINSASFFELLPTSQDNEFPLFASLDVKERKLNGSTFQVANLIFHSNRPKPDGSLNNISNDTFIDYGNACPIDCEKPNGDPFNGGGYDGKPVEAKDAEQRIERYNNIYGPADTVRYIKDSQGVDSMLIARYYAFSQDDIRELLAEMKGKHQFFYVSMGAEKGDKPNTYKSDLIFHFKRPDQDGHLDHKVERSLRNGDDEDEYHDVTTPCPNACDN